MKGFVQSVGAATVVALSLNRGVNGKSPETELAGNPQGGAAGVGAGSAGAARTDSRQLMGRGRNDDALDVNGTPRQRAENILNQRNNFAEIEFFASEDTFHTTNGDRSSAASFHKTLPHDDLGQVDPGAFDLLVECIAESDFDKCEQVPAGDENGFLIQPIGGTAVDMAGAASSAVTVPSAPALNSEDLAAQLAELYWMSLTRDVPFSKYGEDEDTIAAADNLATMPGFANMNGVAVGSDGRADPQSQLFRSTAVGVETGPMISQLLVKDFTLDSLTVTPRQTTFKTGVDYMTDYDDWLFIQNGGSPESPEAEDSEKRYIRNARDLSRLVVTDTIYTEAFRGALILLAEGAISGGANGPYATSNRQRGFVGFGVSHLMRILGSAESSQRASWYQKWNVHLFARPEAVAGTLHNVLYGELDVEFHASLLDNEELLGRVASKNRQTNGRGGRRGRTYLLSQAVNEGSPSHPSYPAGHAVQNGAYATVLKAFVGLERGSECFNEPVFPDDEGLELLPYDGCLTFEGEINKLAVNVAFGRQMCGVHYRTDSVEGLRLGEIAGVRLLQQEIMGFPENAGFEFRLMAGETIRIEADGSFFVNDRKCRSENFQGVDVC